MIINLLGSQVITFQIFGMERKKKKKKENSLEYQAPQTSTPCLNATASYCLSYSFIKHANLFSSPII